MWASNALCCSCMHMLWRTAEAAVLVFYLWGLGGRWMRGCWCTFCLPTRSCCLLALIACGSNSCCSSLRHKRCWQRAGSSGVEHSCHGRVLVPAARFMSSCAVEFHGISWSVTPFQYLLATFGGVESCKIQSSPPQARRWGTQGRAAGGSMLHTCSLLLRLAPLRVHAMLQAGCGI
jgi:hypothetical protein